MLDQKTKKRIDDLRDTLVGKVPDPKGQVEQIMIGLIYKYMNDQDQDSIDLGGKASFFIGDYERYSWNNLFDPKVTGADLVQLYSEAVEKMNNNPNIPALFRDIFKNASLPFKDPKILRTFLTIINEFKYTEDSEQLGDPFEYILSEMGTQKKAGQFRTPRHIIDFLVDIVDPKKEETILDPASGTSGFLISAFKHILSNNTDKLSGDRLSSTEKKKLMGNFNGYDISPDMVRIGLANLYLHGFKEPKIFEYDTLSSDDRWNDYFDIILANPPFMTPKETGINPHNKFGIKSKKSEILFVDYILSHIKPNGRAGIIVPEGIIENNSSAYSELRKKLVQEGLVAIIALPAGVFNPYSPIKTSILIIDKSKKIDFILYKKIENDGFSLGAQRAPIEGSELEDVKNSIYKFLHKSESKEKSVVNKLKIKENDYNLNYSEYITKDEIKSDYPIVNINEVVEFKRGSTITKKKSNIEGNIPVVAGGQQPAYYHDTPNRKGPVITISSSGAYAGFVNYYDEDIYASDCFTIETKENLNLIYLFQVLKARQKEIHELSTGTAQPHVYIKDFKNFEIPLPPIEIQEKIVKKIEKINKEIEISSREINNLKNQINEMITLIYN